MNENKWREAIKKCDYIKICSPKEDFKSFKKSGKYKLIGIENPKTYSGNHQYY